MTLASIGDAVITTDARGRITFLNPAAERLTGWQNSEAVGQPLTEVFRIINEQTRQPMADPVKKVLESGQVMGQANHTLLVARDGREIAIADRATPIKHPGGPMLGVVLVCHDCSEGAPGRSGPQQQRDPLPLVVREPAGRLRLRQNVV